MTAWVSKFSAADKRDAFGLPSERTRKYHFEVTREHLDQGQHLYPDPPTRMCSCPVFLALLDTFNEEPTSVTAGLIEFYANEDRKSFLTITTNRQLSTYIKRLDEEFFSGLLEVQTEPGTFYLETDEALSYREGMETGFIQELNGRRPIGGDVSSENPD